MIAGGIYLIDEGTARARIVCSQNLPAEFIRDVDNIDIHEQPYSTVFISGKPFIRENYDTINPDHARKFGIKSFASIPVMAGERVIGALNVASSRRFEIPSDEREVLSAIGKELGNAIMRLKTEAAIQESEAQYRTLIETTGTGYVILDEQGRVVDANPEYVHLTGHTGFSEIKGRSVIEWTAPHDQERNADAVRECFQVGYIRNFEVDYVDSSGRITPIELNATAVTSKGSVRIVTLCRDISSRRKAEEALRQSETLYRTLADAAQDLIYIINKDDTVAYINTFASKMIGRSRQDIIGRPRSALFPGPGRREAVPEPATGLHIGNAPPGGEPGSPAVPGYLAGHPPDPAEKPGGDRHRCHGHIPGYHHPETGRGCPPFQREPVPLNYR